MSHLLHSDAIKHVAKTLKAFAHNTNINDVMKALNEGLRKENPYPMEFFSDTRSFRITSHITWIFGNPGTGAAATAYRWLHNANDFGHRTMSISDFHESINIGDHFKMRRDIQEQRIRGEGSEEEFLENLKTDKGRHLFINFPAPIPSSFPLGIPKILNLICEHAPYGMLISIDLPNVRDVASSVLKISEVRPDLYFVIISKVDEDIQNMVGKNDTSILMSGCRKISSDDNSTIKAEMTIKHNETALEAYVELSPYIPRIYPSTQKIEVLFGKLNAALRQYYPDKHMEYLELVSKTCGYRSWHAAQADKTDVNTNITSQWPHV